MKKKPNVKKPAANEKKQIKQELDDEDENSEDSPAVKSK